MTASDPFRALADPTRREILLMLAARDRTIAEVADGFAMTRPAVKKHLSVLRDAGLIKVTPRGREKVNSVAAAGLKPVTDWLAVYTAEWDSRLSALKSIIEKDLQ